MQQLVARVLLVCHVLCSCWPCGCRCGCKRADDTSRNTRVIPVVDRSSTPPFFLVCCYRSGVPSSTKTKQHTKTNISPGLKSRGAGLSKGYSSCRGQSSLMVPRCRLHTCSGWFRVCCWVVMCCVRAGHVPAGVAAK